MDFRSIRQKLLVDLARIYVTHGKPIPKGAVIHKGARNGEWYESTRGTTRMDPDYLNRTSNRHNDKQYAMDSYGHEEAFNHALSWASNGDGSEYGYKSPHEFKKGVKKLTDFISMYGSYPEFGEMQRELMTAMRDSGYNSPFSKLCNYFLDHYDRFKKERISRNPDYKTGVGNDTDRSEHKRNTYGEQWHSEDHRVDRRRNPKYKDE